MYEIEIPVTIHQIFATFYQLDMWSANDTSKREHGRKLLYFMYFVSFVVSIAIGAYTTEDKDESIFLAVISIDCIVLIYRLWFVLHKRNEISMFVHEIRIHHTNDEKTIFRVSNKLNLLMKLVHFFMFTNIVGYFIAVVVFPLVSGELLFLNIAFPLDRSSSEIALWLAFVFIAGGLFFSLVGCLFTVTLWYMMLMFTVKYEILSQQFRTMGMISEPVIENTFQLEASIRKRQDRYVKDFIGAIVNYEQVNGYSHQSE